MKYKLVCFDVDGTLVDNVVYSWQIFHDHFKTSLKRREKARKEFFEGKISYSEWARHDVDLWIEKKAKKSDFCDAILPLKLMSGALETLQTLKNKGLKLAVISGSIHIILETLLPNFDSLFDEVYISTIHFNDQGYLSHVEATEFDMDKKAEALEQIAHKHHISLNQCVFVGDESNDVKICKTAGLGIAFNSNSEELKKNADLVIDSKDLREILRYIS